MNEYRNAFNNFESIISEGLMIPAHSGDNGQSEVTVFTVSDYLEADEVCANETWSNHLDSEGLELLIALDDALNSDLSDILEQQVYDSFVNGQFRQFKEQYDKLDDQTSFIEFLDDGEHLEQLTILKFLVMENI